jgi:hypothetical protein
VIVRQPVMRPSTLLIPSAVALATASVGVRAEEAPAVVPYRPTVSTPADLPAPGYPELEAGYLRTHGGDSARRESLPLTFKLAWDSRWALLIGTDAWVGERDFDGVTTRSGGDTMLALKYKWPLREDVALGWQAGPTLATARMPIGSGKTDWTLTGIASANFGDIHVDANVGTVRVGAVDPSQGRVAANWSVAGSYPLDDRYTTAVEASGSAQRGNAAAASALAALSYNVNRALVVDVAASAGLSRHAPDWQLATGLTVQLGRWF